MKHDQYYTKYVISELCVKKLKEIILITDETVFLEPSAGSGSFVVALNNVFDKPKILAFDIDPKGSNITKQDFLTTKTKANVVIGNPPFGKRGCLSVEFFNHASQLSDYICFIVPIQWNKWSIQSKLNKEWKLIDNLAIPEDSFHTLSGKAYNIRTVFQIWTRLDTGYEDLRLKCKPKTKHPDFEMYLYNNTKSALKYFNYKWDFAVPRQGFYDYSRRETNKENCEQNIQWMFFKAKNGKVLERLQRIDFKKLAYLNSIIPGWGKADLVAEYERIIRKRNNIRKAKYDNDKI